MGRQLRHEPAQCPRLGAPGGKLSEFLAQAVARLQPRCIMKTGLFLCAEATLALVRAIAGLSFPCHFISIEMDAHFPCRASDFLRASDQAHQVDVRHGLSLPRHLLAESLRRIFSEESYRFYAAGKGDRLASVCFSESYPAHLPDDLLGQALSECGGRPDLVLLDGGGMVGIAELTHLASFLRGPCLVVLDASRQAAPGALEAYLRTEPRLVPMDGTNCKSGFCALRFNPAHAVA